MAAKGRRPDALEVKIEEAWKKRLDLAKRRMTAHDAKSSRNRRCAWGTTEQISKAIEELSKAVGRGDMKLEALNKMVPTASA